MTIPEAISSRYEKFLHSVSNFRSKTPSVTLQSGANARHAAEGNVPRKFLAMFHKQRGNRANESTTHQVHTSAMFDTKALPPLPQGAEERQIHIPRESNLNKSLPVLPLVVNIADCLGVDTDDACARAIAAFMDNRKEIIPEIGCYEPPGENEIRKTMPQNKKLISGKMHVSTEELLQKMNPGSNTAAGGSGPEMLKSARVRLAVRATRADPIRYEIQRVLRATRGYASLKSMASESSLKGGGTQVTTTIEKAAVESLLQKLSANPKADARQLDTLLAWVKQDPDPTGDALKSGISLFMAEHHPNILAENIDAFKFTPLDREAIAKTVREKHPDNLAAWSKIASSEEKVALALEILLEDSEVPVCDVIQPLDLSEAERNDLAVGLVAKDPERLCKEISSFSLTAENRAKIAQKLATSNSGDAQLSKFSMKIAKELPDFNIQNDGALADICAALCAKLLRAKGEGKIDKFIDLTNQIFSTTALKGKNFKLITDRIGIHLGVNRNKLEDLLTTTLKHVNEKDLRARDAIGKWWCYTALCLANKDLESSWETFKGPLEALGKWRDRDRRYAMTTLFLNCCINKNGSATDGFPEITSAFQKAGKSGHGPSLKPHTALFPILFSTIFGKDAKEKKATLESLSGILKNDHFKRTERRFTVVRVLLSLAESERIDNPLKQQLLRAALPQTDRATFSKDDLACFLKSLQDIEVLTGTLDLETTEMTEFGRRLRTQMADIKDSKDLARCAEMPYRELFGIDRLENPEQALKQFADFRTRARQPHSLAAYAVNLSKLEKPERELVHTALDQLVQASVLSSDPKEFYTMRYDPERSTHLRTITTHASDAFIEWKKSAEWESTSTDDTQTPIPDGCKVVDTDDPEDLFLCGTETHSCQSIGFGATHNKALMGYALDGKYRMLAVKNADGVILARRMLRMLWDPLTKRPVLHVEKSYPENSDALARPLLDLAKKKAQQMNCALVVSTRCPESQLYKRAYENSLESLDSPAPFEFVDHLNDIRQKKYTISDLKLIQ